MPYCSFSNDEIPKGCGYMYVHKDGKYEIFCSSKCMKNMLKLKRKTRKVKWTKKEVALVHEKKVEKKVETEFAKEIAAKLAAKEAEKAKKEGKKK